MQNGMLILSKLLGPFGTLILSLPFAWLLLYGSKYHLSHPFALKLHSSFLFSSPYGVECKGLLEVFFLKKYVHCRLTRGAWERLIFCDAEEQIVVAAD